MTTANKGWESYNEFSGEIETGLYECPFMVRATNEYENHCPECTVASFRTIEQARAFIARCGDDYLRGGETLHIENWNAEGYPQVS